MAEAVFVLSRSTDDPAPYQEIAWQMLQAIDHSGGGPGTVRGRVGGFASWVDSKDSAFKGDSPRDQQPATFLGATLKYLYLTLLPVKDEKDEGKSSGIFGQPLPLTKWVFNAVGQPFPVCGTHRLYAKCPGERK